MKKIKNMNTYFNEIRTSIIKKSGTGYLEKHFKTKYKNGVLILNKK